MLASELNRIFEHSVSDWAISREEKQAKSKMYLSFKYENITKAIWRIIEQKPFDNNRALYESFKAFMKQLPREKTINNFVFREKSTQRIIVFEQPNLLYKKIIKLENDLFLTQGLISIYEKNINLYQF